MFWALLLQAPEKDKLSLAIPQKTAKLSWIKKGMVIKLLSRRVGESFFDYEYLREFEAKIGMARNVL